MKTRQFKSITNFLWKNQNSIQIDEFDFPEYAGLGEKFNGSPESVDAMQQIWPSFIKKEYKSILEFQKAYIEEMEVLGERISSNLKNHCHIK